MSISKSDLVAALAQLSPGERSALMGAGGSASRGTPKFSTAIDAIPSEDIDDALQACSLVSAAADQVAAQKAISSCRELFPELVAAAETNSHYRQKPIGHSFNVAALRLLARKAKGN